MRNFFVLLGMIAAIEMLFMMTVNVALEEAHYSKWVRALVDAGVLAVVCIPLLFNYQLRPLQMAYRDHLTGLPSRLLFHDRLAQALVVARREKKNCAVIYLDLDRFKPVNDTYGHRIGDVVLNQVAERICGCVRESDTVARIGGDEFTVLLTSIAEATVAERVVRKIVVELTRPFEVSGRHIGLGVSAGIALYPDHGQDGIALLDAADDAMYCAKVSNDADYCFASRNTRT
ncbi:MAG: GGDEF domain-containing protein [Nitrosomonadales bacterium]|nr:GGDEF domain-containing protein [Nitrosomonadales bacterium]